MKKIPEKVKEIQDTKLTMEAGSKSISFSQLSLYVSCPKRWERAYLLKEAPYTPNINTCFGTSFHETLQHWLEEFYVDGSKAVKLFNYSDYLLDRLKVNYGHDRTLLKENFSNAKELQEYWQDGVAILDYIKKHWSDFFNSQDTFLVGCEVPLVFQLRPKFYYKGFIDILTYDESADRWKIWDIKTSTRGWSADTKSDFHKTSQLILYKHYLSEQFNIDPQNIDIEYFIVKRKINENVPYSTAKRRVQEFVPPNKKPSIKKAVKLVENFISGALTESGEYQQREYETLPSKENCKWCLFKGSCKEAVV